MNRDFEPSGEEKPPVQTKESGRRRALSKAMAGLSLSCGLWVLGWPAWTFLCPLFAAEPTAPVLNGSWTLLSKPHLLGHVIWPWAVALDGEGELYVADGAEGGRIQKRDLSGNWTLVASAGQSPGGLKGIAQAMAFDRSGNLYLAEGDRIRKRDNQGNWTTLATQGKELGQINRPRALTLDREGNLYVADGWGEDAQVLLRKPDGQWTRLAGNGDDVGQVVAPLGLAVDAKGNLYVTDYETKRIQKRDVTGRWTVVADDAKSAVDLGSPLARGVSFQKLTSDVGSALYVITTGTIGLTSTQLLKRDAEGRWIQLAVEGSGLGQVFDVQGMSVDSTGNLYVAELGNHRIQKRDPNGTWTVVCEALKEPGAFLRPSSPALDSRGNLYVVDSARRQVQKRDAQGRWTVVVEVPNQLIDLHDPSFPVGVDPKWPLPFWLPVFCLFNAPWAVAVDRQDNLYVADSGYNRVMKLNTGGQWELCVPSGRAVGQTHNPSCVSVDASDNLYVIDGGRRLQKRDAQGRWTVLAETTGPNDGVYDICVAPNGDAYVLSLMKDQLGLRMPDSHGGWTMVAPWGSGLGQVAWPVGLATDAIGRLYIADFGNQRLQVRDVDGKWFVLASGSEAGLLNRFGPAGIAVDRQGVVYVTDSHRVFRWTPQPKAKAATRTSQKSL